MQRMYYVVNARMPTDKAHGLQIAKMCAAFAGVGVPVTLLLPRRATVEKEDLFTAYAVPQTFSVEYLPSIALPLSIPGAFALQTITFALSARWRLWREKGRAIVYTRGEMLLFLAPLLPKRFALVWEAHIKPKNLARYRAAVARCAAVVAVTKFFVSEIPTLWRIKPTQVCYAPDGVELRDFASPEPKEVARTRLGLPLTRPVALYIGRIDGWKGVDILYDAATQLPEVCAAVIGGEPAQVAVATQAHPQVHFVGYRPYRELSDNQAAADILVLTGDPQSAIAQRYTSPLKLFTYMASGVPIVAADLPCFRDVLSEQNAFLCEATPDAYAAAIRHVLAHPADAAVRAANALQEVQQYSWDIRAEHIISHINAQL